MREIRFRGKCLDNKRWVEGDLIHCYGKDEGRVYIKTVTGLFEVDPATVGQYTGLKDRNGTEIYEGDIIAGSNGSINCCEWPFQSTIKWRNDACGFNTPNWGYMDSTHYYDVIGNIHDNPELQKGGAK